MVNHFQQFHRRNIFIENIIQVTAKNKYIINSITIVYLIEATAWITYTIFLHSFFPSLTIIFPYLWNSRNSNAVEIPWTLTILITILRYQFTRYSLVSLLLLDGWLRLAVVDHSETFIDKVIITNNCNKIANNVLKSVVGRTRNNSINKTGRQERW